MNVRCWLNEPNMPPGREFEAYHSTDRNWNAALFHSHYSFEFYIMLRGNNRIGVGEQYFHAETGDMFLFPPNMMHSNITDSTIEEYERAYFYTTPECLQSMSTPGCNLYEFFTGLTDKKQYRFHLSNEACSALLLQIDQIIANANSTQPAEQLINRCRLNILLASCYQTLSAEANEPSREVPSRIDHVISYINHHLGEELSTDLLAERFFVSKYHLMHEFRDYTNTSIHQYIIAQRVVYAQQLLLQGIPAHEISPRCGFGDYTGFYRAFLTRVGMTPQQYAQQNAQRKHSKPVRGTTDV